MSLRKAAMATDVLDRSLKLIVYLIVFNVDTTMCSLLQKCEKLPSDYLLPYEKLLGCGLPSSRSFLLSKFNAALVADKKFANQIYEVGNEVQVDIEACEISESDGTQLWQDNITVLSATPWTLESCKDTEVNFWGRIRSETSLHRVTFRASHTKNRCKWQAVFTPSVPGEFVLEISNIWIRGSTHSHASEWKEKKQSYWQDGVELKLHPSAERGSFHIPCGDYCNSFEGCAYYSSKGDGRGNCILYGKDPTPMLVTNESKHFRGYSSGVHKAELPSVHVGGVTGGFNRGYNSGVAGKICHDQAHVLNSPQPFRVIESNKKTVTTPYYNRVFTAADGTSGHDVFCNRGDLPGHWVRWDTSGCPSTREEEVDRMVVESKPIHTDALDMRHGMSALYHSPSDSVLYALPVQHHPNQRVYALSLPNETTPPWQLYPRCAVGYQSIPPNSMEYVPPKKEGGRPIKKELKGVAYSTREETLSGLTYVPTSGECMYRHFSRGQMRQCLQRLHLSSIVMSGDSILGGFGAVLKWSIGAAGGVSEGWYLPRAEGEERNIATASVTTKQGVFHFEGVRCVLWDPNGCARNLLTHSRMRGPSLYVYNFNIQHIMWSQSYEEFTNIANIFFESFRSMQATRKLHPDSIYVFLNSMATIGYREPYCTNPRAERFAEIIQHEARKSGWLILDGFNMTMLRPDMSADGMHFGDEINIMMMQMLMGMVCEKHGERRVVK